MNLFLYYYEFTYFIYYKFFFIVFCYKKGGLKRQQSKVYKNVTFVYRKKTIHLIIKSLN